MKWWTHQMCVSWKPRGDSFARCASQIYETIQLLKDKSITFVQETTLSRGEDVIDWYEKRLFQSREQLHGNSPPEGVGTALTIQGDRASQKAEWFQLSVRCGERRPSGLSYEQQIILWMPARWTHYLGSHGDAPRQVLHQIFDIWHGEIGTFSDMALFREYAQAHSDVLLILAGDDTIVRCKDSNACQQLRALSASIGAHTTVQGGSSLMEIHIPESGELKNRLALLHKVNSALLADLAAGL